MIDTDTAIKIKARALAAVAELDGIIGDVRNQCSEEDLQTVRLMVGLSIGNIVDHLLEPVLQQHPEIDDLKG